LARVKLSFVDTKIRLEHIPFGASSGVGIEVVIDRYLTYLKWSYYVTIRFKAYCAM